MSYRLLPSSIVAIALVLCQTPTWVAAQSGAATSPKASGTKPAKVSWTPPRTPWGHPDLEGVWTSDGARGIPRERPAELAGKALLTDEEFAQKLASDEKNLKQARGDARFKTKTFRQTSLIVEPADGRTPPFTPEALKRAAGRDRGSFGEGPFNSPEDFTLYDRCITRGIVGGVLPVPYGNGNRILQTPDEVVISYEMIHDTRVIPLDGRPHVGRKIRQYLGDSRGHWEGNTLVVETTNFTDQTSVAGGNGNGLRHSADLRLVERITRMEPDVLQYDVRIEDAKTYARPWTISVPLISPPGFELLPYECHEGNVAVMSILSAERTEDKALEDDAKRGIVRARKGIQGDLDIGGRLRTPPPAPVDSAGR
jgi:hypothetical protein